MESFVSVGTAWGVDKGYLVTASHVLAVETVLPDEVRYWQALVGDDRFCTVDWVGVA